MLGAVCIVPFPFIFLFLLLFHMFELLLPELLLFLMPLSLVSLRWCDFVIFVDFVVVDDDDDGDDEDTLAARKELI